MSFQTCNDGSYRGRFAPTPSGPLHLGSLIAALGSHLEARARGGEWLLRIEDLDPPRVVSGAALAILDTLAAHGLVWDGPVVWQGRRRDAYAAALENLREAGLVYACRCSRKMLGARALSDAQPGADGPVYPGTCRAAGHPDGAWRLWVEGVKSGGSASASLCFEDGLLGRVCCDPIRDLGDFVVQRADGVFAYQLAVAVDDAEAGITDVVRGADLLASTPRQILLQRALNLPTPRYLHLPVLLDARGDKLSKQTLAAPLVDSDPLPALRAAMDFLGFTVPAAIRNVADFWRWAVEAWDAERLPRIRGSRGGRRGGG